MAWTDDDQHLTRTREELLSRVTRRGEELRRRRRGGRLVATIAAVIAVAAVAGIGIAGGGGDPAVQVATDGPLTTTGGEAWVEPVPGAAGEFPTSTSTPGPDAESTPGSVPTPPSSLSLDPPLRRG